MDLVGIDTNYHQKHCYYCGERSDNLTRDHVPPRGFFPKGHRQNLITVPACPAHNEEESHTDEVTRGVIALLTTPEALRSSDIAETVAQTTIRGMHRPDADASDVMHTVYRNIPAGRINRDVFVRGIGKIARGLYYHVFRKPWGEGQIISHTPLLFLPESMEHDSAGDPLLKSFDRVAPPSYGENPQVFSFQLMQVGGIVALRMNFYECVPIVAVNSRERYKEQSEFGVKKLQLPQESLDVYPDRSAVRQELFARRLGVEPELDWQPVVRKEQWHRASSAEVLIEHEVENLGLGG